MRNLFLFIALEILVFGCCSAAGPVKSDSSITSPVTITIVCNNVACDSTFTAAWGFSCYIAGLEKTILFDGGNNAGILQHNMKQANIDPDRIHLLILSHRHNDHVGGIAFPDSSTDSFRAITMGPTAWKNLETAFLPCQLPCPVARTERVDSLPAELFPHIFLTGIMPGVVPPNVTHGDEQSLIIDTQHGLVLITGCSHPGIVAILKRAKEIVHKDIYLVLGGFHLLQYTDEQIRGVVSSFKSMGVQYCGPLHCTGDKAVAAFREAYGDHFVDLSAGRAITLDKDGLHIAR